MLYTLPPVEKGKFLPLEHFPDRLCAFVFRNWGMIGPDRLAAVVGTTEEKINGLAERLGLPVPSVVNADWLQRGYITVIRANWHLLPYSQLCALLGWSEQKLAYTLKEDDFLDFKLGRFKPDVPELRWHEIGVDLSAIHAAAEEFFRLVPPETAAPFSFDPIWEKIGSDAAERPAGRGADRIVYSYCALYGDTFTSDFSYSFSDSLLKAYRSVGVNGIWCQAVLYTLVPFPFAPALSEGWENRLNGVRALTERLAAYGIRLFLYLNEPRALPNEIFEAHPQIKGDGDGEISCLCTSVPEVRQYLFDSAARIASRVPLLGGFITISGSENRTHCYSHRPDGQTTCPRCRKRRKSDVISEVNGILYRGVSSVNPAVRLIAWTWGWEEDLIPEIIRKMPAGIAVMNVSEQAVKKEIGGVTTSVIDYSLSVQGPGDLARSVWKAARESGHAAYAKCQFNNTWECSFVPFLPVFRQVYQSICGIRGEGVGNMLLDWTLGGFPSPTFFMLSEMDRARETPSLSALFGRIFPKGAASVAEEACRLFSLAFDAFPFHIEVAYKAPQNYGPSNLLYPHKTGFRATMIGYPYDDLDSWKAIFPADVLEAQFGKLSEMWGEGIAVLSGLSEETLAASVSLRLLVDCAEAAYCHFRSAYLQIRYVRLRGGQAGEEIVKTVSEEAGLCLRLAAVQARNPCIGYESSNHYFYYRAALAEKYVNCQYILRLAKEKTITDRPKEKP